MWYLSDHPGILMPSGLLLDWGVVRLGQVPHGLVAPDILLGQPPPVHRRVSVHAMSPYESEWEPDEVLELWLLASRLDLENGLLGSAMVIPLLEGVPLVEARLLGPFGSAFSLRLSYNSFAQDKKGIINPSLSLSTIWTRIRSSDHIQAIKLISILQRDVLTYIPMSTFFF